MIPAIQINARSAALIAGLMMFTVCAGAQTIADENKSASRDSKMDVITYRVVDFEDKPVKGALVRVFPREDVINYYNCREEPTDREKYLITSAKGIFILPNHLNPSVKGGWGAEIWVNHIGLPIELLPDKNPTRIIHLPRFSVEQVLSVSKITGVVLDEQNQPQVGVSVSLVPWLARDEFSIHNLVNRNVNAGKTGADGSYAIDISQAGDYLLRIDDGHVNARAKFPLFIPASSQIKARIKICPWDNAWNLPKCEPTAEFSQPETSLMNITGTIFDNKRKGLARAIIKVHVGAGSKGVEADDLGKFAIRHLNPGCAGDCSCYRISAWNNGYKLRYIDVMGKFGYDLVLSIDLESDPTTEKVSVPVNTVF